MRSCRSFAFAPLKAASHREQLYNCATGSGEATESNTESVKKRESTPCSHFGEAITLHHPFQSMTGSNKFVSTRSRSKRKSRKMSEVQGMHLPCSVFCASKASRLVGHGRADASNTSNAFGLLNSLSREVPM